MGRASWLLAAALAAALGLCCLRRVRLESAQLPGPDAPPEDALISLQGSRPIDTEGNEVSPPNSPCSRVGYWYT